MPSFTGRLKSVYPNIKPRASLKMQKASLFRILTIVSIGVNLLFFSMFREVLPAEAAVQSMPTSLAPMLEKVLPAVVSVHVEGSQVIKRPFLPKEFRYFFGPDMPGNSLPFEGLGSGVIINATKGYVITNNHVINGANAIKVQLNDGRELSAKIVGKDEQTDLALLQLSSSKNLSEVTIANSDELKVGDFAIAVGNPFGLGQTATSGIVSALGRSGLNLEGLENFIQTDASINRGNSGGALVNLNGELIGINTAILAPSGGNVGIGFAIPSNIVKNLSHQLIKYGEVKRGRLGIKGTELTADIARAFNIDAQRGAFVSEVLPNSAASKAGIRAGDIVVAVEDKPIQSFAELRVKVGTTAPGNTIKLSFLRNGKLKTTFVVLDDNVSSISSEEILTPALQGASFSNTQLRDGTKGVRVEDIIKDSPASLIGLQKGDVIIGLNRERIQDLSRFRKVLKAKPAAIALNIVRGDASIFLLLR